MSISPCQLLDWSNLITEGADRIRSFITRELVLNWHGLLRVCNYHKEKTGNHSPRHVLDEVEVELTCQTRPGTWPKPHLRDAVAKFHWTSRVLTVWGLFVLVPLDEKEAGHLVSFQSFASSALKSCKIIERQHTNNTHTHTHTHTHTQISLLPLPPYLSPSLTHTPSLSVSQPLSLSLSLHTHKHTYTQNTYKHTHTILTHFNSLSLSLSRARVRALALSRTGALFSYPPPP